MPRSHTPPAHRRLGAATEGRPVPHQRPKSAHHRLPSPISRRPSHRPEVLVVDAAYVAAQGTGGGEEGRGGGGPRRRRGRGWGGGGWRQRRRGRARRGGSGCFDGGMDRDAVAAAQRAGEVATVVTGQRGSGGSGSDGWGRGGQERFNALLGGAEGSDVDGLAGPPVGALAHEMREETDDDDRRPPTAIFIYGIDYFYCESWSKDDAQRQFILELGIPGEWMHEALALYHEYYGDKQGALENYLPCGNWKKAHTIFMSSVAHSLFLSSNHQEIWEITSSLENHKSEIADWDLGAGIYIDYYILKNSMQEESTMDDQV
ncbi:hypothetical protein ACP70R_017136 [Stipagrostis hirtigluma subsp. patula]